MRAASYGYSTDASSHWLEATEEALARLEPVDGANVALVYATDFFSGALDNIRQVVSAETGVTHVSGTTSVGVFCTGQVLVDTGGVVVLVMRLPRRAVASGRTAAALARPGLDGVALIHLDLAAAPALLARPPFAGLWMVGGVTASRGPSVQVHSHGTVTDGVTGLILGPEIEVHADVSQGCLPTGPIHAVTEARGNVVSTLDGEPALTVLMREAEPWVKTDPRRLEGHFFAAVVPEGHDRAETYLVRNLLGVNLKTGSVAVSHRLESGAALRFTRRDGEAAREDLNRMCARLVARGRRAPIAAVLISCVARGRHLFGAARVELDIIEAHFGALPMVGFYANGEVSGGQLYGQTAVLMLIYGVAS